MNPATIREHITIEPTPPGGAPTDGFFSSYNNRYRLNFSAEANTTYTVTIEPGMEDIYGNVIERG